MKGFAVELPIIVFIALAILVVSVAILITFSGQFPDLTGGKIVTDVKYACSQYNGEKIDYDTFITILYGFVTQQCTSFKATLTQKITFDDVERSVAGIDKRYQTVKISSCKLPEVDAKIVYFCCGDAIEKDKIISIERKNIYSSGVIICEI